MKSYLSFFLILAVGPSCVPFPVSGANCETSGGGLINTREITGVWKLDSSSHKYAYKLLYIEAGPLTFDRPPDDFSDDVPPQRLIFSNRICMKQTNFNSLTYIAMLGAFYHDQDLPKFKVKSIDREDGEAELDEYVTYSFGGTGCAGTKLILQHTNGNFRGDGSSGSRETYSFFAKDSAGGCDFSQ